ncbi:hypothetical protein lerEdw1_011382, partial [Lerista edwardsae]
IDLARAFALPFFPPLSTLSVSVRDRFYLLTERNVAGWKCRTQTSCFAHEESLSQNVVHCGAITYHLWRAGSSDCISWAGKKMQLCTKKHKPNQTEPVYGEKLQAENVRLVHNSTWHYAHIGFHAKMKRIQQVGSFWKELCNSFKKKSAIFKTWQSALVGNEKCDKKLLHMNETGTPNDSKETLLSLGQSRGAEIPELYKNRHSVATTLVYNGIYIVIKPLIQDQKENLRIV